MAEKKLRLTPTRALSALTLATAFGCANHKAPEEHAAPASVPSNSLDARVRQFAEAELTADIDRLPQSEQQALAKIIEASKLLDPIFDRQAYAQNPELREKLAADDSPAGKLKLQYFDIMRGPWDRQDDFAPFAIDTPRPPGAGFYPADLTVEEFNAYIKNNPQDKEALESLLTVVRRDGPKLTAVPFHEAYKEWLEPAAKKLEEAAALTKNESLKRFLTSRAKAFSTDDYYESDKDWMDLESVVEVTIGPYETYEDKLLGLKASYEAFVTVSDPEASAKLLKYKALLPEMEAHLPIPDDMRTERGGESPIRVVDLVYTSGDARKSVQTIAFNLPNDERVRKEKGSKKVMMRNIIKTKFELILRPIAGRILDSELLKHLSGDAFFDEVLFHELSHGLGPAYADVDGKDVELRTVFGADYSPLEEAKADVMGAYNILFLMEKGEYPKSEKNRLLVSYFAGLFRSVRFGVAAAHGRGAALQINRYLSEGAATFDESSKRFSLDLEKLEESIEGLVRDLCVLQREGDKARAESMLGELGVVSKPIETALSGLDDIPVDLKPIYPVETRLGS